MKETKGTLLHRFSKVLPTVNLSKLTNAAKEKERKNMTIHKFILCIAVIVLVWIPIQASAQLTLDDFTSGHYGKRLDTVNAQDIHNAALPPNSPLGAARQTTFQIGSNPYAQWSTFDLGKGICIVDGGFGVTPALWIFYGETLSGTEIPLGLNLAEYSGFQLNFAGLSTSGALLAIITVWPHDNGVPHSLELVLTPEANPTSLGFPFSMFSAGGLSQNDLSDIDYIFIQVQDGVSASWGVTAFQAVN
jgi:hypothetical protein